MEYAALRNFSFYSLLDSTLSPRAVVEAAARCGMRAVGLTDRDTLAGAVQFQKEACAAGIHPVLGSEVTLEDGATLVLYIENQVGYSNLCRLLTTRIDHPEGVRWEDVARFSEGLICVCGSRSPVAAAIRSNRDPEPAVRRLREIFGARLALAIYPHNEEDLRLSRVSVSLARRLRIPVAATAEAHYLWPEHHRRYRVLEAIRTLSLLGRPHPGKRPAGNYHFHSPQEMAANFGALPQALRNTLLLAERCQFRFTLGEIHFPRFPSPEPAMRLLRRMAEDGLLRRYGASAAREVRERLERELRVIEEVGYADYFLIYADIVRWAAARGIGTLARGSAAGSLVCYLLGIGNVCPFRFGLCFERFLNRERMHFSKLADIDLDLPWDRRDEVVDYVFERYGREHAAMIGAFNTFQGRAAVAEVAKVFGVPEREVRRVTEHLPHFRFTGAEMSAEDFYRNMPECRHLPLDREPYRTVLEVAAALDGMPRHFSMHPCGLVISPTPLAERIPLFLSAKGLPTTHYAMDDVEELGLLKMDLLGQAGLSVLREARANIRETTGREPSPEEVRWDDLPTWELIASGQARGVFHIESPAMTSLLVMTNCRDIDCLTAVESIIRPGAANEGKKRAFARRYQGLEPASVPHPSLETLLADTFGLMAYEEHILLVANGFAGMPWGRADLLRRALVKNRDRAAIERLGEEFRASARALGRTEAEIAAVWDMVREFAGYMFNKAHSAAYAVEAFEGAWLKARFPLEFLAAVLTNRRGFYAPIVYVLEALRHGARFLPPDLNRSDLSRFTLEKQEIRLPLNQVRDLSTEFLSRLRERRPFASPEDFYLRAQPARPEWLALLKTGALDGFGEPRSRLFWKLCRMEAAARRPGRTSALLAEPLLMEPAGPEWSAPDPFTQAAWENEYLGFPVSLHPLEYFAPGLDWSRFVPAAEFLHRPGQYFHRRVEVCGLVVAARHHTAPRGPMKFLTLADFTGFLEVSLFPETYQRFGHLTTRPVLSVTALANPFDNRRGCSLEAESLRVPVISRPLGSNRALA